MEKKYRTFDEVLAYCRIRKQLLKELIEEEIIPAKDADEGYFFEEGQLRLINMAKRLHDDMEVNVPAIGVILRLREQMDRMRDEMNMLEREMDQFRKHHEEAVQKALKQGGFWFEHE